MALLAAFRWDGCWRSAFAHEIMLSLLLYAYCAGKRSSRRIERLWQRDVAFRVIAANDAPDHATIARFHQRNAKALFTETLRRCAEPGLAKAGLVALDGTKIKASASRW